MSPSLSVPCHDAPRLGQFRIGTLMMVTLVAAMIGSIARLSVPIGCLVSIPLTLGLLRTLTFDPRHRRSLPVVFVQSLWLLGRLGTLVSVCVALTIGAAGLSLLHPVLRFMAATSAWMRDRVCIRNRMITSRLLRLFAALLWHLHVAIVVVSLWTRKACLNVFRAAQRTRSRLATRGGEPNPAQIS